MLYSVPLSPVRHLTAQPGVGISLKMQAAVNENSGGGQIPTVCQDKAEVFLETKSISEVQCHTLILFSFHYIERALLHCCVYL